MNDRNRLVEQLEAHRNRLQAMAYRMLGSLSEADDALQESWIRLSRSDASGVENMGGWLTTIVSRVCFDMLRSRKSRREELTMDSVSEPTTSRQDGSDPEHEALIADSVGLAMLVVLEKLSPAERIAFVLQIYSPCLFRRSLPLSGVTRPQQGSWRAALDAGFRMPNQLRKWRSFSEKKSLSMHSSPRRATETLRNCSRYWIPMSYSETILYSRRSQVCRWFAVQKQWPSKPSISPIVPGACRRCS